jgi:hypothetical protein
MCYPRIMAICCSLELRWPNVMRVPLLAFTRQIATVPDLGTLVLVVCGLMLQFIQLSLKEQLLFL